MRKMIKNTLIFAGVLIVSGMSLLIAGTALGGKPGFYINRQGLFTAQEQNKTLDYVRTVSQERREVGEINDFFLDVDDNDIVIMPSEDHNYYVEYSIPLRGIDPDPVFKIEDNQLNFQFQGGNMDYSYSAGFLVWETGSQLKRGYVKLYVPEQASPESMVLKSSGGKVSVSDINPKKLDITAKYGEVELSKVNSGNLSVFSSDGSIDCQEASYETMNMENKYGSTSLGNIKAENIRIDTSDGTISLDSVEALDVILSNQYGSIEGEDLKTENFSVKQSDGSCEIEDLDLVKGEFENSYGSIRVSLIGKDSDYNYDLKTTYGSIIVSGQEFGEGTFHKDNGVRNSIQAVLKDGSIEIETK